MKTEIKYKVVYFNEETGKTVDFDHAFTVNFNKERAENFIKEITYDRAYGGGTQLPKHWRMKAIQI